MGFKKTGKKQAKKPKSKTPKQKASLAQSRYIRLKAAIEYCRKIGVPLSQFNRPEDIIAKCSTCNAVKSWIRMDMGHCIGRGSGGGSGVYFNEDNLDIQCKPCNGFYGGRRNEFEQHLKDKHGGGIMEELERLNMTHRYSSTEYPILELYYKQEYKRLVKEIGI
jgi:hypothetical protein